jgi:hypothetical protein
MKQLIAFFIAATLCVNAHGQCAPDIVFSNSPSGIYPDSLTFLASTNSVAVCGQDFSTVLTLKTWVDSILPVFSQPVLFTFDASRILDISGLPPGFNWAADGPTWDASEQVWHNQGVLPNLSPVLGCVSIQASFASYSAAAPASGYIDYPLVISMSNRMAATDVDLSLLGIYPGHWVNSISGGVWQFTNHVLRIYAISNPTVISYNTSELCPGSNSGIITLSMSGFIPPVDISVNSEIPISTTSDSYSLNNLGQGAYEINVTDVNGCTNAITAYVDANWPFDQERMCLVTVDSISGFNTVQWEKTSGVSTDYFNIYKQNSSTSQYDNIGWVPFDSLSVFIDQNSSPAQGSNRYAISVVDSCGSESTLSPVHRTIHLSSNQGINGETNLLWNAYEGFGYPNFEVYRSNNSGPFILISNVSNTDFSYSDLTPPSGSNQYRIAVVNPDGCTPTRAEAMAHSNTTTTNVLGISQMLQERQVELYPNPANGRFNLMLEQMEGIVNAKVYDIQGREVWSDALVANGTHSQHSIDLTEQAKGIYTLQLQYSQGTLTRKLVKN